MLCVLTERIRQRCSVKILDHPIGVILSAKDHLVSVFETIHKDYPWAVSVRDYSAKDDILVEDDDDDDDTPPEGKATVIIGGGQSEFILGQDDLIGEMSFLLGNKRTASIVAKEDVICWAVSVSNMEKILKLIWHWRHDFIDLRSLS